MQFRVRCGNFDGLVEATNFKEAVSNFLRNILENNNSEKLGEIVLVHCESPDTFFDTQTVLQEMGVEQQHPLRICPGSLNAAG